MTITCEVFKAEHAIELGGDELRAIWYEGQGRAFTMKQDGRVVACAGLVGDAPAYLWSLTAPDMPLRTVHKAALRFLRIFCTERIESFTAVGNEAGCRWLELLGFVRSDRDGEHHHYVRHAR